MGSVEKAGIIVVAVLILIIAGVGLMNRRDGESAGGSTDTVASNSRTSSTPEKKRPGAGRLTGRKTPGPARGTKKKTPSVKPLTVKRSTQPGPPLGAGARGAKTPATKPLTARGSNDPKPPRSGTLIQPVARPKTVPIKPKPPVVSKTPSSHTIKGGDVLSSIAFKTYGTTRMVPAIVAANPGVDVNRLQVGQKLKLPAMDPALTASTTPMNTGSPVRLVSMRSSPATRPGFITASYIKSNAGVRASSSKSTPQGQYKVKSGDTISSIAQKQLGSVRHAGKLVAANQRLVKHPNRLQVGWLLKLPPIN